LTGKDYNVAALYMELAVFALANYARLAMD
jgi:hypothetical protein